MEWIVLLPLWIGMALVIALVAKRQGRDAGGWFLYGFLLWPVALVHVLCLPPIEEAAPPVTRINAAPTTATAAPLPPGAANRHSPFRSMPAAAEPPANSSIFDQVAEARAKVELLELQKRIRELEAEAEAPPPPAGDGPRQQDGIGR